MQRIIEIFNELKPRKNNGFLKSLDKGHPYYFRVKEYQKEVLKIYLTLTSEDQDKIRGKVEYINNCLI